METDFGQTLQKGAGLHFWQACFKKKLAGKEMHGKPCRIGAWEGRWRGGHGGAVYRGGVMQIIGWGQVVVGDGNAGMRQGGKVGLEVGLCK